MATTGIINYGEHSYNQNLDPATHNQDVFRVASINTVAIDTAWNGLWQYNYAAGVPPPTFGEEGLFFNGGRNVLAGQVATATNIACLGIWFKALTASGTYGIVQIDSGGTRRAAIWQVNTKFYIVVNNTGFSIDDFTIAANTWYYCVTCLTSASFYVNGVQALVGSNLGLPSSFTGSWLGGCNNTHAGQIYGNCIISDVYLFNTTTSGIQPRSYKQSNYPQDLLTQPQSVVQNAAMQFMRSSRGT